MAIELTTASDFDLKRIRTSLKALGVSGSNSFTLNGNMLATGTVIITGGSGPDTGLIIPNGQISLGYSAPIYGSSNDGAAFFFDSVAPDNGELVIQTRDNGDEPIVFRQIGGTPSLKEPLIIGSNNAVAINAPPGQRTFDNALSVFGNISASGSLYVQSIVQNSLNPLTIDVTSSDSALRVIQRGTGNALKIESMTPSGRDSLRVTTSGTVVIGASANLDYSLFGHTPLNILPKGGGSNSPAIRIYRTTNSSIHSGIYFYNTRQDSVLDTSAELLSGDNLFTIRGFIPDSSFSGQTQYRGNASFFAELTPNRLVNSSFRPSDFVFSNNAPDSNNTRETVRITCDGNLGIGTSTPLEKLTVVGNISATGDVYANSINGTNIITNSNFVQSPTTTIGGVSGVSDIRVMTQTAYDLLTPKLSATLYIIV